MQIDIKALEQALATIQNIGKSELTFDVGGTSVTIRMILPFEEVEVQKFAATALNDSGDGEHQAVAYLDRFRLGTLSYAITQVGDLDFRGVTHIETGETLDNGNTIKVSKAKALQTMLGQWSRTILTGAFAKFHELVDLTEWEAEKAIHFEPSDIDAELDRLRKKVKDLEEKKAMKAGDDKNAFSDHVRNLAESDATSPEQIAEAQEAVLGSQDDFDGPDVDPTTFGGPQQPQEPVQTRQPIIPDSAAPPAPQASPTKADLDVAPMDLAPPESSFVDAGDDDGLQQAAAAEHARLVEMRRRVAQGNTVQTDNSAMSNVPVPGRQPPHLAAQGVEDEIQVVASGADLAARVTAAAGAVSPQRAEQIGEIDGKPVFREAVQGVIETPTPKGPPNTRVPLNQAPATDNTLNPRFRKPKGPNEI